MFPGNQLRNDYMKNCFYAYMCIISSSFFYMHILCLCASQHVLECVLWKREETEKRQRREKISVSFFFLREEYIEKMKQQTRTKTAFVYSVTMATDIPLPPTSFLFCAVSGPACWQPTRSTILSKNTSADRANYRLDIQTPTRGPVPSNLPIIHFTGVI